MTFGKRKQKSDDLVPRTNSKNVLRDHPEGHEGSSVDIDSSLSADSLGDNMKPIKQDSKTNGGRRKTTELSNNFQVPQVRKRTANSRMTASQKSGSANISPINPGGRKRDLKAANKFHKQDSGLSGSSKKSGRSRKRGANGSLRDGRPAGHKKTNRTRKS